MALLSGELQASLDAWIAKGNEDAGRFWYSPYVAEAHGLGAAQSAVNLSGLSHAYAASRSLRDVIFTEPYRTRVGFAQIKSYEHWTGQSAQIKSDLAQIIGSAVADGKNPAAVRTVIRDSLGVSKSKAAAFAQTDITDALRQARMAEAESASEEFGMKIGLLWTSALKPTTRPTHARRNGKVFTTAEVKEFYGRDGNRYNCRCAVTEALLDSDGAPILTKHLRDTMTVERELWRGKFDAK
jgi:SPP1 gp7 family putative phage head morphogenesis protein